MSVVTTTCTYGLKNDRCALLEAIACLVDEKYNSKQEILHLHTLLYSYVTANVNATFTRPRNHYIAVARAIVKTIIKCDGVPVGAKQTFQKKMHIIQRIFMLMYRPHEFRVSHAAKSDMYTFLNRANWTHVISNRRKLLVQRCFLLTHYKQENRFCYDEDDLLLWRVTQQLPYELWPIIYQYM